jgi:hypothetical protein
MRSRKNYGELELMADYFFSLDCLLWVNFRENRSVKADAHADLVVGLSNEENQ